MAKRRKVYVDQKVQGALARRVVLYWAICLWGTFCVLAGFPIVAVKAFGLVEGPSAMELMAHAWGEFWPSLAASVVILPLVIWDVMRVSNRFAGPMIRLRRGLRDLADGKEVRPLKFRDGDFWMDFADDFNYLAESLQKDTPTDSTDPTAVEAEADEPEAELVSSS